ncbi:MAG: rcc01693 family protein [Rhizobiaceae bacterium]
MRYFNGKPLDAAAGQSEAFPWDDVLAVGLGLLRLSPSEFWSLTTREFAALAQGLNCGMTSPLERQEFQSLMREFPDEPPRRNFHDR